MTTTSTVKPVYGTSTAIVCTLTGLAASATVGRQCTPIDNTTNLFTNAKCTIGVQTIASAPASSKAWYIFFFASEDGTNYTSDDAAIGASDAGYTVNAQSNLKGPFQIYTPTASKTYREVFDVCACLGVSVLPRSWGFVACNDTNQAGGATAIGCTYTGENPQIIT